MARDGVIGYRQWVVVLRLIVALLMSNGMTLLAGAPGASATVYEVTFTDICGGVTVTTDAPDGTSVRLTRDVNDIGGFPLVGGHFTVGAGIVSAPAVVVNERVGVSLDGQPEVFHFHEPASCLTSQIFIRAFDDRCFGDLAISFENRAVDLPGFVIAVDGDHATQTPYTVISRFPTFTTSGVEDGDVITVFRQLDDGVRAFYANHRFRAPAGCGPQSLSPHFGDVCDGFLRIDVRNDADGYQAWLIHRNGLPLSNEGIGGRTASVSYVSSLVSGDEVTLLLQTGMDSTAEFGRHTYRVPPACANPGQSELRFIDSCDGTRVEIVAYGRQAEYKVQTPTMTSPTQTVPGPLSAQVDVSGSPVTVSRGMGNVDFVAIGTHEYVAPADCSILPVTGSNRPWRIAFAGAVLLLVGLTVLILTFGSRGPRPGSPRV